MTISATLRQGINFIPHAFAPGYVVKLLTPDGEEFPPNRFKLKQKHGTLEIINHDRDTRAEITIIG
jgi:hypothetical protein